MFRSTGPSSSEVSGVSRWVLGGDNVITKWCERLEATIPFAALSGYELEQTSSIHLIQDDIPLIGLSLSVWFSVSLGGCVEESSVYDKLVARAATSSRLRRGGIGFVLGGFGYPIPKTLWTSARRKVVCLHRVSELADGSHPSASLRRLDYTRTFTSLALFHQQFLRQAS